MSRTFVVTGSASGIGQATAQRLKAKGHQVLGVDLRGADIEVDLATPAGQQAMASEVARLSGGCIDGIAACAGVLRPEDPELTLLVNFFGAVATLELLRPLLARSPRPRALAICSTAAKLPGNPEVVQACLASNAPEAIALAGATPAVAYSDAKRALALWLRRAAGTPEWGGAGILLNGIAPGLVDTAMTRTAFEDATMEGLMKGRHPVATGRYGQPKELAEVADFLLNLEGGYMLGQILFVDGGTDAISRTESF